MKALVEFHTRNKIQLKAYNEKRMRELGRIVANQDNLELGYLYMLYEQILYITLRRAARCSSYYNVLMNSLGYFSKDLKSDEKQFFLHQLKRYREGRVPLVVPVDIMKSWIIRTNKEYLAHQTFFNPYPDELLDIDSIIEACGDRDYWKTMN